jgi:hypothetical protein
VPEKLLVVPVCSTSMCGTHSTRPGPARSAANRLRLCGPCAAAAAAAAAAATALVLQHCVRMREHQLYGYWLPFSCNTGNTSPIMGLLHVCVCVHVRV